MERFTRVRFSTRIMVCMALFLFGVALTAHSAEVTLYWDKPDDDRIAGYKVYYGKSGEEYKNAAKQTVNDTDQNNCDITGLEPGEVYAFSATSVDGDGNESDFSEELFFNVSETSADDGGSGDSDGSGDDGGTSDEGQSSADDGDDGTTGDNGGASGSEDGDGSTPDAGEATNGVLPDAGTVDPYYTVRVSGQPEFNTQLLKLNFGESGSLSGEALFSSGGEDAPDGLSYTAESDGRLTIGDAVKGTISTGKHYFVAGSMAADAAPSMMFGIRQSSEVSDQDFEGDYKVYLFETATDSETGKSKTGTKTGTVAADGAGGVTISSGDGFAGTYTVDSGTGQLTISPDGGYSEINGILSANGEVFAGVDTDDSDGSLLFVVGIKSAQQPVDEELAGSYYANELISAEDTDTVGTYMKMTVEANGSYAVEEIDKTCDDCNRKTSSGNIVAGENGQIEAVEETENQFFIGLAPNTELFTVSSQDSIGIGIRESSGDASSDSGKSSGDDDSGNGGGGGGCFIRNLMQH